MTHLSNKPPYGTTEVHYTRTKIQIEEMLKEFNARALRWTETPDSMQNKEMPILEFIVAAELKGVERNIGVKIQPPLFTETVGRGYRKIRKPNMNASMRMLYWYLKARLEAVKFGMEDVFETFMSRIMGSLPDGTVVTMAEVVKEHPEVLSGILPTFEIKALPKKEKETKKREIIEVEVR